MKAKALIIGATGKTGMPIVEGALEAGLAVRAVIRREDHRSEELRRLGAETGIGDVHDLASVRELVRGVDRIYFTYPPQLENLVDATVNVALAAREAGIETVVNMSQIIAREGARSRLTHAHWLSEQVFDMAGVGATHVRPTYFMENLLLFSSQSIAGEGKIYLPYGTRGQAPIAAADIARTVVHLLAHPEGQAGERHVLTGPELFDLDQIAGVIGQELGRSVEYVDLPAEHWYAALTDQVGLPEYLADHLHKAALDQQEGLFEHRTDTVEQLTGRAPQPLEGFVRDHLPQFEGKEPVSLGL